VSHRVIWQEPALRAAERFAASDPDGVRRVFDAADLLADNPRPEGSTGSDRTRRVHVGFYRIMYRIDDGPPVVVSIEHLGRRS
jgi:mRNA interferase RelE/StbE